MVWTQAQAKGVDHAHLSCSSRRCSSNWTSSLNIPACVSRSVRASEADPVREGKRGDGLTVLSGVLRGWAAGVTVTARCRFTSISLSDVARQRRDASGSRSVHTEELTRQRSSKGSLTAVALAQQASRSSINDLRHRSPGCRVSSESFCEAWIATLFAPALDLLLQYPKLERFSSTEPSAAAPPNFP